MSWSTQHLSQYLTLYFAQHSICYLSQVPVYQAQHAVQQDHGLRPGECDDDNEDDDDDNDVNREVSPPS